MQLRQLTETLSVSGQIDEADVELLAAQGFRSLINNRPDGEAAGQPDSAVIAALAARHDVTYQYLPVISGQLQDAQVEAFTQALTTLPAPTLAFCRTGTRSTMLWALGAARSQPVEDVLRAAAAAGYDLDALRPRLQQAATR
ncbi:TIGR01244 family sulfur transferase [Rhodanobacter sp. C05]|uniref:TIGR01244 family sulfur transferase n=1 Tax=Rhodanobacter sp. C05 TaxID=1945855 RepID=UPI000987252E|nr:TIGR01244 family sulfur transferase [Rhodanobacter sp. C05]OOG43567.1 TIGR01244 family protein [Rhodanobacter sp. C05]